MNEKHLVEFHEWYKEVIETLISADNIEKSIIRKIEHTSRVCDNILELCEALCLNKNDVRLAEVIALFHDIGRFYQYLEYKTFLDYKKDHAELGVDIIIQNKVLDVLPDDEKDIILKAIRFHNMYELPDGENDRVLLLSKLIRDADKLDIYNIHIGFFESKSEEHGQILEVYPDLPEYSNINFIHILNNICIKQSNIKTYNDLKLTYISWIFDISFNYSIKKIIDKNYIERLFATLPKTNDIQDIRKHMKEYIRERMIQDENV